MKTRTNPTAGKRAAEDVGREIELENIVGNLLIADYQVEKLKNRLAERVGGYGSYTNKKDSALVYKHNDKWYRISLKVEETAPAPVSDEVERAVA